MNQFKHAMITRSTVISFETAAKVVGKDELIQFVRRGIVKRIRRSNRFSPTYLDSLPQRFRQAFADMIQNPSLLSSRAYVSSEKGNYLAASAGAGVSAGVSQAVAQLSAFSQAAGSSQQAGVSTTSVASTSTVSACFACLPAQLTMAAAATTIIRDKTFFIVLIIKGF